MRGNAIEFVAAESALLHVTCVQLAAPRACIHSLRVLLACARKDTRSRPIAYLECARTREILIGGHRALAN